VIGAPVFPCRPLPSDTIGGAAVAPFARIRKDVSHFRAGRSGGILEKAKPIQSFLELYFDWSGPRVAQQKDELHRTRLIRDNLWVRYFVIDDPFSPVRKVIHDKYMAAFQMRVPDVPSVENELAVNAVRRESGG
jgi:hypothetical protein